MARAGVCVFTEQLGLIGGVCKLCCIVSLGIHVILSRLYLYMLLGTVLLYLVMHFCDTVSMFIFFCTLKSWSGEQTVQCCSAHLLKSQKTPYALLFHKKI